VSTKTVESFLYLVHVRISSKESLEKGNIRSGESCSQNMKTVKTGKVAF